MQPERWQQISGIFKSALALKPEERVAYVAAQCGTDESLRREVELLIESHHKADKENFIKSPAVADVASLLVSEDSEAEVTKDRLEKGQQVSHYRIIKKLGAGGMGEVYLAEDTRLDRTVALKILPADVASNKPRMQRFKQEAKLASSLNQPNILTIFEFGDTDSLHFIASEFVDGATLRENLRGTQLKLPEMIDISTQVVAALDAAHEAKIVHRDIKPENIMVRRRDRVVKVLDFGLAKLTEKTRGPSVGRSDSEANTEALVRTMPGNVMGTVHYMSPEQAQGLRVDERTDLWSTGVVIYEMVAGRVPFAGVTSSHTVVDILEKEPAPLPGFGKGKVPAELQRIVSKALAKNPDERYQTAKDLLIDLRNLRKRLELDQEIERSGSATTPGVPVEEEKAEAKTVSFATKRVTNEQSSLETNQRERSRASTTVLGLALAGIVLSIAAVFGINAWRSSRAHVLPSSPPSNPLPVFERTLNYWMTVQKYRDGKPFERPFDLAGEINFEKDYQVRLNVSSAQGGYLYVLNESPVADNSLQILFPSPTANNGSALLAQQKQVLIPEQSWFKLDAEQGRETVWLVFSANAIPQLDALQRFANQEDQGVINDAELNRAAKMFIQTNSTPRPSVEKSDDLKQTSIRSAGSVLVYAIKLAHN